MFAGSKFKPGDPLIYRTRKRSAHPGPRAEAVEPEPNGEGYVYEVDKFWIVSDVTDDGQLTARTRRGKLHRLSSTDPALRKPRWWERIWYAERFPLGGE